jgi:hypothetical protein
LVAHEGDAARLGFMRPILTLPAIVAFTLLALSVPVVSAGSCNVLYDPNVTGSCLSLDPGSHSEPSICLSSSGTHCGAPCVLSACVTSSTQTAECFSGNVGNLRFATICAPICLACISQFTL